MSDNSSIFDNSTSTQRLITATTSAQTFSNSQSDTSYSLDSLDTQDFFRLRLSQRSSVVLTLTSQNANADIAILDAGGTLQQSSNGGTLADAFTTDSLNAGDYYIRVSLADSSTSTNYTLKVKSTPAARADLLWRNASSGQNAGWLMNGNSLVGTFNVNSVGDPNWKLQGSGDFNGDDISDYIWRNSATGENAIWLMNADNTLRSGAFTTGVGDSNWKIAGTGDFDGDGQTDLVWRNYTTGANAAWYMNGTTLKSSAFFPTVTDLNSRINGVGDFNGDGKPDLVWRNYRTGQNTIWLMDGLSLSSAASFLSIGDLNWNIVGVGDANGDGKQDIFWRNYGGGDNVAWVMNGTTYSTGLSLLAISDANWRVGAIITGQAPNVLAGSSMGAAFNIGTLNNTGSYDDSIGGAALPNGYYKFNLTTSSVLNLSLTGLGSNTNADLQVIQDKDGNGVLSSQSEIIASSANLSNADELISNLSLTSGTYFIRVLSSSTQKSAYTLSLSAASAQKVDLLPNPSSTFTITKTNGQALPSTVSLDSTSSNYLSAVRVNYSIRNDSTSVITPSVFKVSFYLSRDNTITASDLLLGTIDPNTGNSDKDVFITSLAPGQNYTQQQTLSLLAQSDSWWGGDQTYYIGMIIDSGNQVSESNESNNTASAGIVIRDTLQPDLLGGGLVINQTSTTPGQAITFTGSIKNIGNKVAGSTRALVKFYFSNDDVLDGSDTVIATASIAPLAAQSSVSFNSTVGLTGGTLPAAYFTTTTIYVPDSTWSGWKGNGRYYLCMYVDFFDAATEGYSKENNLNYGRSIGQYTDYDFIDVTGAPNNAV
ncbi:MAG: FG-GAP repeat protein [Stenomitos rutilans HA7619-LM2]|nr:FG-GAP repeat protein [Stenomitos rutilans HA7619-LM2]